MLHSYFNIKALPINSGTALNTAPGQTSTRHQHRYDYRKGDDFFFHRSTVLNTLSYGITKKFDASVALPFYYVKLQDFQDTNCTTLSNVCFGDFIVTGRYRYYAQKKEVGAVVASVFAGVEFPTATSRKKNKDDVLLPRSLQPGSGSFDLFAGLLFTRIKPQWELDASVQYKVNTEGKHFNAGNVFTHNFSFQYRVSPKELVLPQTKDLFSLWSQDASKSFLPNIMYLVLEANGLYREKTKECSVTSANSGEYVLFLSPGFQFLAKNYVFETSLQLPVVHYRNGRQPRRKFTHVFGFRAAF